MSPPLSRLFPVTVFDRIECKECNAVVTENAFVVVVACTELSFFDAWHQLSKRVSVSYRFDVVGILLRIELNSRPISINYDVRSQAPPFTPRLYSRLFSVTVFDMVNYKEDNAIGRGVHSLLLPLYPRIQPSLTSSLSYSFRPPPTPPTPLLPLFFCNRFWSDIQGGFGHSRHKRLPFPPTSLSRFFL